MNRKTILILSIILIFLLVVVAVIIITSNKLYKPEDLSNFEDSVWMDEEDRCGVDNTGLCMVTCKGNFDVSYPKDDRRCEKMIGIKGLKCCILS
jgi:hypothetical protein